MRKPVKLFAAFSP